MANKTIGMNKNVGECLTIHNKMAANGSQDRLGSEYSKFGGQKEGNSHK